METPRKTSTIGYMFATAGMIWGALLGAVLTLTPVAVFLAYWFESQTVVLAGLAPFVAAILIVGKLSIDSVGSIVHPIPFVESLAGFLIEFLFSLLLTSIALPYVLLLTLLWVAGRITGNPRAFGVIALYNHILFKGKGTESQYSSPSNPPEEQKS